MGYTSNGWRSTDRGSAEGGSRGGGHEKRDPAEGVPPGSATVARGRYPWVVNFGVPRCGPRHTSARCRSYTPEPMEAPASAPDTAVLIVGGGPTGLLLACALRRRGVECVLVDAYDEPLGWDRATVIHPRSLQIFEAIGIVDEFTTTGVQIRACRIHADGTVLGEMDYRENRTRYPFDIGLSEDRTEQILTRYLDGVGGRVVRSTRLVDLDQRDDRVVATLETHGEQRVLTASWVVGCDGYRSTVRDVSGIVYEGSVPDEPWAVFDAGLADGTRSGTSSRRSSTIRWSSSHRCPDSGSACTPGRSRARPISWRMRERSSTSTPPA